MYPTPLLNVLPRATPNLTNLRHQLQHSATAGRGKDTSERDTKTHLKKHKKVALYDPSIAPQTDLRLSSGSRSCRSAPRPRQEAQPPMVLVMAAQIGMA